MAAHERRDRLMTIRGPVGARRELAPTHCAHCGRDASDRDHELLQAALRARIRVLEARVCALEAERATAS